MLYVRTNYSIITLYKSEIHIEDLSYFKLDIVKIDEVNILLTPDKRESHIVRNKEPIQIMYKKIKEKHL